MSLFSLSTWSIFWAGWVKGIILHVLVLTVHLVNLLGWMGKGDNVLPNILFLAVHLVNLLGWMGKGDHSKTFLLL